MNHIKIIHISDIHFENNEPENQGLIISAFFNDLESRIEIIERENTFCIISGDLVNKGNSDKIFEEFYNTFILRLTKVIPLKNIYCSPGNHDLNRKIVEKNLEQHNEIVNKKLNETEFNHYIQNEDLIIKEKFSYYENFCKTKLHIPNFNLLGYSENPIPEISFYFLNCSLFCYGGFKGIDDKSLLKIETSGLNKWIQENNGRTKVLVMHHPLEYLTSFAKNEIKSMLINDIDILISGHIHNQELEHNFISESHGIIKIGSPQLFSDKTDLNGYAILSFSKGKGELESIEYRQWVKRQRKFMIGQDFSSSEDGIRKFKKSENIISDSLRTKLFNSFQKSMKSYSIVPCWIERTLKTSPPNSSNNDKDITLDYLNIINTSKKYQIIAAPQFGLTCFGRYLALKAWEVKKENWLYLDSNYWTYSKYHSDLEDALSDFNLEMSSLHCILLDNWKNTLKDSSKILENITRKMPNVNIIILSNFHDNIILEGLDSEESHDGFTQLYLSELKRSGLRNIVRHVNTDSRIGDENRVLERLDIDLIDLNIHRTPLNCLQILIAFLNNFEERPINRTKVFNYILKVVFENPGNLYYGNTLDEENCRFILGYFCEYLLRNDKDTFTEEKFHEICIPFCKENYNTTNTYDLLSVLKNNQILVNFNGSLKFRFSYWVYYFASLRMKFSAEFSDYMFNKKHSLYFPEIIEFYTGIDGAREDVVSLIINDLGSLSQIVHNKVGINKDFNPFKDIKWALNETKKGMTQEQLMENVQKSKLPEEIKDVVADNNYNSVKPYSQTINNFLEEFEVKNLMDLTKSASRALRNSEFISSKSKEQLIEKIFLGWQETIRVLFLIAPVLAKNGFGGVGGARFKLTDDFPKEFDECLKTVITNMPYNLKLWYKDDIFSDKLILLLRKYMIEFPDPNIQHVIALLECSTQPKGWKNSIMNYIEKVDKNSFYLGDLCTNLIGNYTSKFMNSSEVRDTEFLIKACYAKHKTGSPKPGINTVSKVSDDLLPQRNLKELE